MAAVVVRGAAYGLLPQRLEDGVRGVRAAGVVQGEPPRHRVARVALGGRRDQRADLAQPLGPGGGLPGPADGQLGLDEQGVRVVRGGGEPVGQPAVAVAGEGDEPGEYGRGSPTRRRPGWSARSFGRRFVLPEGGGDQRGRSRSSGASSSTASSAGSPADSRGACRIMRAVRSRARRKGMVQTIEKRWSGRRQRGAVKLLCRVDGLRRPGSRKGKGKRGIRLDSAFRRSVPVCPPPDRVVGSLRRPAAGPEGGPAPAGPVSRGAADGTRPPPPSWPGSSRAGPGRPPPTASRPRGCQCAVLAEVDHGQQQIQRVQRGVPAAGASSALERRRVGTARRPRAPAAHSTAIHTAARPGR